MKKIFFIVFILSFSFVLQAQAQNIGVNAPVVKSGTDTNNSIKMGQPAAKTGKAKKAAKKKNGIFTGSVTFGEGEEKVVGVVSFFRKEAGPSPDIGTSRRVPERVARLHSEKGFTIKIDPGTYYLGAMKWKKGRRPGPPRANDKYIFIRDENGEMKTFQVKAGETVDLGVLSGAPADEFADLKKVFTIKGKVVGEDGIAYKGAVVLLKQHVNAPRPSYIAEPTADDGKYSFDVPPGTFFLFARESLAMAGRPKPGSFLGTYGETDPIGIGGRQNNTVSKPVTGKVGDVFEDMDIVMFELPDPAKKREETLKQNQAQKIDSFPPGGSPLSKTVGNDAMKVPVGKNK